MKLTEIKTMSATGLQHMVTERKIVEIDVNLQASTLLLPENGFYKKYKLLSLHYFNLALTLNHFLIRFSIYTIFYQERRVSAGAQLGPLQGFFKPSG